MRSRSRVAFPIACAVYAVTVVLAWRKVLPVPNGRGDAPSPSPIPGDATSRLSADHFV